MERAFTVKSARIETFSVRLHSTDLAQIHAFLQEKHQKYQVFAPVPFVLELDNDTPDDLDFSAIVQAFAEHGLRIIAVRHRSKHWQEKVQAANLLSLYHQDKMAETSSDNHVENTHTDETPETENVQAACNDDDETDDTPTSETDNPATDDNETTNENDDSDTVDEKQTEPETEPEPELTARPTLVVNTPVRTGQQVYAKNADLIVLGMVSEGAEVIADGNIHIYAPMRGRALAGESGDTNARIFMQSMQAELVSIAGIYRVFEQDLPPHLHKQAVRIELQEDDRLAISAIQAQ